MTIPLPQCRQGKVLEIPVVRGRDQEFALGRKQTRPEIEDAKAPPGPETPQPSENRRQQNCVRR